jgi:hypothetical protein
MCNHHAPTDCSAAPRGLELEKLVDEIIAQGELHLLDEDIDGWRADLKKRMHQVQQHPEHGLGFIEEHIRQSSLRLQCLLVQKAMQEKADAVEEQCPDCHHGLCDKKRRVVRWVDAYCGKVKLSRTHGWCPQCEQWVFPADRALGLCEGSSASPLVQEMCALLVSKMPAEQAEAIALRVTGRSLSRSTLGREAQRQGDSALEVRRQLVEAPIWMPRARGLTQAQRVLAIADGAVWIWNLVEDRFQEAEQRLDLFHANTYLWAVANELPGTGTAQARQWVKPLLKQIRNDQVVKVITQLEDLKPRLAQAAAKAADKAIDYYQDNKKRMKYKEGRKRNEPVGSGAIESTCRQLQCRMKRCGQFWSTRGDEALLCLEMFWRNNRWELLFPHAKLTAVANN